LVSAPCAVGGVDPATGNTNVTCSSGGSTTTTQAAWIGGAFVAGLILYGLFEGGR